MLRPDSTSARAAGSSSAPGKSQASGAVCDFDGCRRGSDFSVDELEAVAQHREGAVAQEVDLDEAGALGPVLLPGEDGEPGRRGLDVAVAVIGPGVMTIPPGWVPM